MTTAKADYNQKWVAAEQLEIIEVIDVEAYREKVEKIRDSFPYGTITDVARQLVLIADLHREHIGFSVEQEKALFKMAHDLAIHLLVNIEQRAEECGILTQDEANAVV